MRRSPASALFLTLIVGCAFLVGGVSGLSHSQSAPAHDVATLTYDVSLDEHGHASWNVSATFPVHTEAQTNAFEALAAAFVADDGDEYLPIDPFRVAAEEIGTAVDREMAIEDEHRSVYHGSTNGTLSVTFRWTEFAAVQGGHVVLGDVFTSTDRPWLGTLGENEHLRIHAPDGHLVQSSGMPVENRTLVMDGPQSLSEAELRATFVPLNGEDDEDSTMPAIMIGGMGLLSIAALLLLAATYYRVRKSPATPTPPPQDEATDGADEPPEPDATEDQSDLTLLSDEERVLRLVEHNGGRMKQADIVTETDWSNAKVSQLLSKMAEEGRIEKLRIGRENLISFPGGEIEESSDE